MNAHAPTTTARTKLIVVLCGVFVSPPTDGPDDFKVRAPLIVQKRGAERK